MTALLVHGWMVTGRVWDALVPVLEKKAVVAKLPFAPLAASLEALATDVIAQADAAGLERFDLVGHSMGGQIAQLVAARASSRIRSLALINPVPLGGLSFPEEVAAFFRTSGKNRNAQDGILSQACLSIEPDVRAALLEDAGSVPAEAVAAYFDLFAKGADTATLSEISVPTWVLATDDPFLPPALLEKEVVARIRGARLEVLHGPGHYPLLERTAETALRLQAFWEST